MDELLRDIDLTKNEIKVYKALLKIKKGTKTPIVKEAKVLSSKVYEILDRLIERGFVAYFREDGIKTYVPVHPENVNDVFDKKIKKIKEQKSKFTDYLRRNFKDLKTYITDVQVFKGWNGLKSAFKIIVSDLKKGETYYLLGGNPGEDVEKAMSFFPQVSHFFEEKNLKRKVVFREEKKKEAKEYFRKFGSKGWQVKYYPTFGPLEIGITNNYVMLSLLEKEPIVILINNKKIRDSYLVYFNTLWKLSKK